MSMGTHLDQSGPFIAPDWSSFAPGGGLANGGPGEGDANGEMVWPDMFHYDSMFRYAWTGSGTGLVEGGHDFGGSWS